MCQVVKRAHDALTRVRVRAGSHVDTMSLERRLGWLCDPCAGVNPRALALTLAGAEAAGRRAYLADTQ